MITRSYYLLSIYPETSPAWHRILRYCKKCVKMKKKIAGLISPTWKPWELADLLGDNVWDIGTSRARCLDEVLCTKGKVVPDDRGCQHKKLEAMLPTLAPFDVGLLLQMLSSMPVMLPFVSFQKLYFLQMLRILRFTGRGFEFNKCNFAFTFWTCLVCKVVINLSCQFTLHGNCALM